MMRLSLISALFMTACASLPSPQVTLLPSASPSQSPAPPPDQSANPSRGQQLTAEASIDDKEPCIGQRLTLSGKGWGPGAKVPVAIYPAQYDSMGRPLPPAILVTIGEGTSDAQGNLVFAFTLDAKMGPDKTGQSLDIKHGGEYRFKVGYLEGAAPIRVCKAD